MKKTTIFAILALLATGVFAISGPVLAEGAEPVGPSTPVSKDGVTPTLWTDNPNCVAIGYGFGFKINQSPEGTFLLTSMYGELTGGAPEDSTNSVTISNVKTKNGDEVKFDWSSTLGIDAVIVKGGPEGANVYVYDPEDTADQGLGTPGAASDISHIEFCYDYELTAEKTANAEYTRTYTWDITKSVDPGSHTGWFGDEFSSSYDVFVDQTATDSDYKVTGQITINNPTPFEVPFSVEDYANGTLATVTCPDDDYTLDAGETKICSYVAELGDTLPADGTNTATITSWNAYVQGATASDGYTFGDPTTIVGEPTINVTDYFDGDLLGEDLGSASGDYTFEYDRPFECPTGEDLYTNGEYTDFFLNYAEIDETGQSDDARVDLTCYKPVVSKDADTEWFEQYDWTITKDVVPDSHTGFAGDEFTSGYDVFVDQTISQYGYRAFGSITVFNPSGEAITVDVADAVNGAAATVDCDGDPDNGVNATSLMVAAGATGSCAYTVDLDSTAQRLNTATVTISNGSEFEATADVIFGDPIIVGYPTINVTDYFDGDLVGDDLGSASGDYTFEYDRDFDCPPADSGLYTGGMYTDFFLNYAEIDETEQQDDARVDLTCYIPADAKVVKTTTEGDEDIGQFPFTFKLYGPDDVLVETQYLYGAGEVFFATELRAEGTWTVVETLPDGWVSTTDLTCSFDVFYPAAADQTFVCEFDNVEKVRVDVLKFTNGIVDPSKTWTFAIYEGPDGYNTGALVTDNTSGDADGLLDFDNYDLDPFQSYTLCELEVPVGWSTFWQIDLDGDGVGDATVLPYNPNADDVPSEDLGNRCVDFGANTNYPITPGNNLHFVVDNQAPGGAPRTPGYWKNWNRCTGGGQAANADRNGGWQEGYWLLEDVLDPSIGGGISWGDFEITGCPDPVSILDARDIDSGKKKAKDGAYTLARALLAAQLNFGAGACTTQEALDAALAAETLLVELGFDGTGNYLRPKNPKYAEALYWYEILDAYNNGEFCGDGHD